MPQIAIDEQSMNSYASAANSIANSLSEVKSNVLDLIWNVDDDIRSQYGIQGNMKKAANNLAGIADQMNRLSALITYAGDHYRQADYNAQKQAYSAAGFPGFTAVDELSVFGALGGIMGRLKYGDIRDALSELVKEVPIATSEGKLLRLVWELANDGLTVEKRGRNLIISGSERAAGQLKQLLNIKADGFIFDQSSGEAQKLMRYVKKPKALEEVAKNFLSDAFNVTDKDSQGFIKTASEEASEKFNDFKNNFLDDGFRFTEHDDFLDKSGKVLGYAAVALDVGYSIFDDVNRHKGADQTAADATVTAAKGLTQMAVATAGMEIGGAIGTAIPIPVVGTVVGAAAGFAIGYLGAEAVDGISKINIGGETLTQRSEEFIKSEIDGASNLGKSAVASVEKASSAALNEMAAKVKSAGGFFAKVF